MEVKKEKVLTQYCKYFIWRAVLDSNQRPQASEADIYWQTGVFLFTQQTIQPFAALDL